MFSDLALAASLIIFLMFIRSTDTLADDENNKIRISGTNLSSDNHKDFYYLEFSVTPEEMHKQLLVGEVENIEYHVKTDINREIKVSVLFSTSNDKVIDISSPNPELVTLSKSSHKFSLEILAVKPGQTELKINRSHDIDVRDVEYFREHSLVHISVYKSDICYKIALGLGNTFAILSIFGFSPQVILNQVRKSVAGFNIAFLIMEVMDTSIYLIYTLGLYFMTSIYKNNILTEINLKLYPLDGTMLCSALSRRLF